MITDPWIFVFAGAAFTLWLGTNAALGAIGRHLSGIGREVQELRTEVKEARKPTWDLD
jgi:hypothetical protein